MWKLKSDTVENRFRQAYNIRETIKINGRDRYVRDDLSEEAVK